MDLYTKGCCIPMFPNKDEAVKILTEQDDFLERLTYADILSRTSSSSGKIDDVLKLIEESANDWKRVEEEMVLRCFNEACKKIGKYRVLLPSRIMFCKTSGEEEIGSAYCRGKNIIVLNIRALKREEISLTRLIIHELFHIISRNNEKLQEELYKIIGFYLSKEITIDENHRNNIITNPDACKLQYYFKAVINGKHYNVYPVLLFEPQGVEQTFSLYFYEHINNIYYDVKDISNFYNIIGLNTYYILHPEEIMAENFTIMCCREEIKTERVIQEMIGVLDSYI